MAFAYDKEERSKVVLQVGARHGPYVGCPDHYSIANDPYWHDFLEHLIRDGALRIRKSEN